MNCESVDFDLCCFLLEALVVVFVYPERLFRKEEKDEGC